MKKLLFLAVGNLAIFSFPLLTKAIDFSFDPGNTLQNGTGLGNQDPVVVVSYIINWVLSLLGLVALVLIIYAGFMWMSAAGNEERVTKAKDILKAAVIGLVIILGSYGIANYVFSTIVNITTTT